MHSVCMPSTFLFYREVNFFDGAVFKCTAIMTNFIRVDSLKGTSRIMHARTHIE